MRARIMVLAAAVAVLLSACGDSAATDPPPAEPGPSEPGPVESGPAAQLAFLTQPPDVAEGQVPFGPVEVTVQDADGNLVTDATAVVTLTLAASPSGEALGGSTAASAANGIATFSELRVTMPGDGFVLEASSGGLTPAASTPFAVRLTFVQESVGFNYTCAVTIAGFAYCWGSNGFGQLGDGTTTSRATPTPVAGDDLLFAWVSAADSHTCGVTADDVAYCWGYNGHGELGDGTTEQRETPTRLAGDDLSFARVSAGTFHTCGLTTENVAYCWGRNDNGELGDGSTTPHDTPTRVFGDDQRFARVSAGSFHTCGVTLDNVAYCWGFNGNGELGDGTTTASETPTAVAGQRFALVSAGHRHTCGVTLDNLAYCWGRNDKGQLGDGSTTQSETPTRVFGDDLRFELVSAGEGHTCGVNTGNVAHCWGDNAVGGLGDGTTEQRETPTPLADDLAFARVSAGSFHTCGLTLDNVAYCWGFNGSGQLGDGTTVDSFTPVRVVQ